MKCIVKKFSAAMLALCMVFAMSVPTFAANTTLKTKNVTNAGTCTSVSARCTNYGWMSNYTGYRKAKIKLSSAAVKEIKAFCSANKVKGSIPETVTVNDSTMTKLAWANKYECGKVTVALKLVDTNGDKKADRLYMTVTAAPKKATTFQGNVDTYVTTVKTTVK